jgi:fructokinase
VEVDLDDKGKPVFTIHQPAAWDEVAWTPELEARVEKVDAGYFGTLGQRGEVARSTLHRILDVAKTRGILRVLDVNLRSPFFDAELIRESVRRANVLKISDEELPVVLAVSGISESAGDDEKLRSLLAHYDLEMVVMTRGADGVLVVTADEIIDQAGLPTEVIDTVGAGDSFTATFVMGLLAGKSLALVAREACERAAFVCTQLGAVPDLSQVSEGR